MRSPARPDTSGIVLTGQAGWCAELAEGLERYAGLGVTVAAFDTARSALRPGAWRALRRASVVVVVGFRPAARTLRGYLFDAAFALAVRARPPKRVVHYWIGSDVQRAVEDETAHPSARFARAVARTTHFAGSAGLAEDLARIGVPAEVVDFPWLGMPDDAEPLPMPEDFTVLTYVPDHRAAFYGGPQILEAARALPAVPFLIVGGNGAWAADGPPNVRFLGWQADMRRWYEAAACVLRLVRYDSVGGTVIEALAYGRTVLYSRHLPHTIYVPFDDVPRLVEALGSAAASYEGVAARPDEEASAWARDEFDPARLYRHLAGRLAELEEQPRVTSARETP